MDGDRRRTALLPRRGLRSSRILEILEQKTYARGQFLSILSGFAFSYDTAMPLIRGVDSDEQRLLADYLIPTWDN